MDHLLAVGREKDRALARHLCPVDQRIQDFLRELPGASGDIPRLPATTLVLDRPGLARALSLPNGRDKHANAILTTYRVRQGVLHNPRSDRRTTQGIFHVAEGGLPIPNDKKAVPLAVFGKLLARALQPPREFLQLPFTAAEPVQAECFVSLHLRPVVVPAVPGFTPLRSMETRFFVPGGLVANLDFVESIFGNAGDPHLPENDAGLDPEHWTGHTGAILLAPHLNGVTKSELGLPRWEDATERQRRDGMCWRSPSEPYNDGTPFKLTARTAAGSIVTLISDNYFGYCKKEVKTQISFAANLLGRAEEEHAGGAIVFPSYDLGEDFRLNPNLPDVEHTFAEALALLGDRADPQPDGWARDRLYPDIHYVPSDSRFDLRTQRIAWREADGSERSAKLLPGITYVLPSGYKVEMVKPDAGRLWRLRGTRPRGSSATSRARSPAGGSRRYPSRSPTRSSPAGVRPGPGAGPRRRRRDPPAEFHDRFRDPAANQGRGRPILSPERSLGSVVKLLSRSPDYTDEYNAWVGSIPRSSATWCSSSSGLQAGMGRRLAQAFQRRHHQRPARQRAQVPPERLLTHYLRVGFTREGGWRTFSLSKDFLPAEKIQVEDDITASTVAPRTRSRGCPPGPPNPRSSSSTTASSACSSARTTRSSGATTAGPSRTSAGPGSSSRTSSRSPGPRPGRSSRTRSASRSSRCRSAGPSGTSLRPAIPTTSCRPPIPGSSTGSPRKNPRYLQNRPDLEDPRATYLARDRRPALPAADGRRARPLPRRIGPDGPPAQPAGPAPSALRLRPDPLPGAARAFMDLSEPDRQVALDDRRGFGGSADQGPVQRRAAIADLNNALVSFILTGLTASPPPRVYRPEGPGRPRHQPAHPRDLVPAAARGPDPADLIAEGHLERCVDFSTGAEGCWRAGSASGSPPGSSRPSSAGCSRNPARSSTRQTSGPRSRISRPSPTGSSRSSRRCGSPRGIISRTGRSPTPARRSRRSCTSCATAPGRAGAPTTRDSGPLHPGGAPIQRLVPGKARGPAGGRRPALGEPRPVPRRFLARAHYSDVAAKLDLKSRLALSTAAARAARAPSYLGEFAGTLGAEPAVARNLAPLPAE